MDDGGAGGKITKTVCVTGSGGFVASWLVRLLLSRGDYVVHGTVRDPDDPKNAHLMALPGAGERLRLFKADLLDRASVASAVAGCHGVFHVASPVPAAAPADPDAEVLAPAVTGTRNVLEACKEASSVRRVVVVSSVAAVIMSPEIPKDAVADEDSWSDEEYCRANEMWYCLAKTMAEREAVAFGEKAAGRGLDVVTVCPPLVLGPLLQPTVNTTSLRLVAYLNGETVEEKTRNMVDVRDVADALVLAYEAQEAAGRRYICSAYAMKVSELIGLVRSLRPDLKLDQPKTFVPAEDETAVSSNRLQALGWRFRTVEESLRDTVASFEAAGILKY